MNKKILMSVLILGVLMSSFIMVSAYKIYLNNPNVVIHKIEGVSPYRQAYNAQMDLIKNSQGKTACQLTREYSLLMKQIRGMSALNSNATD